MTLEQFQKYCLSKPGVTEEMPFGPTTLVYKVMNKMFALSGLDNFVSINLKCDPEEAIELRERYPEVQPGYHMSKKHWNTVSVNEGVDDSQVFQWIDNSYELIVGSLPKKPEQSLRIDKYIWCVRLAKTRSVAAEWVKKGKVKLNNAEVKVSKSVSKGDTISIVRGNATFQFKVLDILERRVGAPKVKDFLSEVTPLEEIERYKEYQLAQRGFHQNHGDGRASKRDRRALEDFMETWAEEEDFD